MFQLVVAEKYIRAPDTIARTLECFSYPPDRCLLMFDYDPDPTAQVQVTSAEDLVEHIATLWPVFRDVGYLRTYSTRSAIRAKAEPDAWLVEPRGMHIYFLVTGDVARFRELLRMKLWCAGLGFCKLATANKNTGVAALLERALIDLTVLSPERLDYVAGAQIHRSAPFYQDRPQPELHAGIVLNLDELEGATDEERQEYARRLEAAKDAQRPEQRDKVRQRITQQAPTLSPQEQEQEITRRLIHAERDELLPEHLLYFPSREITAQDLTTKAGKALDSKRLKDPQEPDYGPSQAVFHWRGGDWRIVSWAHGILKTYRLARPAPAPPPDEDTADLLDQVEQETAHASTESISPQQKRFRISEKGVWYRQVQLYFENYGNSRFEPWREGDDGETCQRCHGTGKVGYSYLQGLCFTCRGAGKITPDHPAMRLIQVHAGWSKATDDGGTEFYVQKETFRQDIARGLDIQWLCRIMKAKGYLLPATSGKNIRSERVPGHPSTPVYRITAALLGTRTPAEKYERKEEGN